MAEIATHMHSNQIACLPKNILVKVNRVSMLKSLEARVSMIDHRLVEFANRLPLSVKFAEGIQKYPFCALAA